MISWFNPSYRVISHHIKSYRFTSYRITSRHVIIWHKTICHEILQRIAYTLWCITAHWAPHTSCTTAHTAHAILTGRCCSYMSYHEAVLLVEQKSSNSLSLSHSLSHSLSLSLSLLLPLSLSLSYHHVLKYLFYSTPWFLLIKTKCTLKSTQSDLDITYFSSLLTWYLSTLPIVGFIIGTE